jgi:glutamine amidotransferase-like uncharacterized protein
MGIINKYFNLKRSEMFQQTVNKKRKTSQFLVIWLMIFLLTLLIINCKGLKELDKSTEKIEKIPTIAIYSDKGTWEESVKAAEKMFQWMGYEVELIDANYINKKDLYIFEILCFPGGDMFQYAQDISLEGKDDIRDFVSDGGGYIGICGGAYFASEKVVWQENELPMIPLGLFSGTAKGPIDEIVTYPDYSICKIDIVNTTYTITESEPDSIWILYYWGPMLLPEKDTDIEILGMYDKVNQPAILSFNYDFGRVFLIGTHPEIEENSDRDGLSFGSELDDRGSDWDLMKKATIWCLKENL